MAPTETLRANLKGPSAIPFREWVTCTKSQACHATGLGKRKINELIATRRIETLKLDGRRLIVVDSLLKLLNAGCDAPLVEPPQLRKSRETRQGVVQ